jgi:hypothetical protein
MGSESRTCEGICDSPMRTKAWLKSSHRDS